MKIDCVPKRFDMRLIQINVTRVIWDILTIHDSVVGQRYNFH